MKPVTKYQFFPMGKVVATPGALAVMKDLHRYLLGRYRKCDWGDLDAEDWKANDDAVVNGDRILASYPINKNEKVWIITEWDRSVTTILLPSEY